MSLARYWSRLSGFAGQRRSGTRPAQAVPALGLELLEDRTLLAVSLTGGVLSITGPLSSSNVITLSVSTSGAGGQFHTTENVDINGLRFPFDASALTSIVLDTGGTGGTIVNVLAEPFNVPLRIAGFGPDTINVGNPTDGLQDILSDVALVGNASGLVTLNLDDSADSIGQVVNVTPSAVTGLASNATLSYDQGALAALNILGSHAGGDTFNVQGTPNHGAAGTVTTTLSCSLANTISVGNATDGAQDIQGRLGVADPNGLASLTVDDSADPATAGRTATVTAGAITGLAPGPIDFGAGALDDLVLKDNGAGNTLNIRSTSNQPTTLLCQGSDTVNAGGNGVAGAQSLNGPLFLGTAPGSVRLNIDDSGDPLKLPAPATITDHGVSGLAPAAIFYDPDVLAALTVEAGSGGNTFDIRSTPTRGTPTSVVTTLSSQASDNVVVGDASGVQDIRGNLLVENPSGGTSLSLLDQQDNTGRTVSIFSNPVFVNFARVSGLAPADISFDAHALSRLYIKGGTGGSSYNVSGTPNHGPTGTVTTQLDTGGADTVNVGGGPFFVLGTLSVTHWAGATAALTVDDALDGNPSTVTITRGAVTGLTPAPITYDQSALRALTVSTGPGKNTVNVQGTPNHGAAGTVTTNLVVHAPDVVNVGGAANGAQGIQGTLAITASAGPVALGVADTGDSTARHVAVGTTSITGLAPAPIQYGSAPLRSLAVAGGAGNDTFTLTALLPAVPVMVDGGAGVNTLVGPDRVNTWALTGPNSGVLDTLVSFAGMANVKGGASADVFKLHPGGSISGTVDGGAGSNTLDYTGVAGGVAVTLQKRTATWTGGFANIGVLDGNGPGTRLVGANTPNTWLLTGNNAGSVGSFSFSGVGNLIGGNVVDVFKFSPGGHLSGGINGGGGGDWLDYSALTTPVTVNLATGSATGLAAGCSNIQNVKGGAGNDTLTGNASGNVLVGGAGHNLLQAGSGRSVLIAGAGGTLKGGAADDLLIAGSTTYDSNLTALASVLAEWQRSDRTYAQRISDLRQGGGLNGTTRLSWGVTVKDNGVADTLTGGPGQDWFFANLGPIGVKDLLTDRNVGGPEVVD